MASGSWLLTTGGAWNNNANWSAAFPNALTDAATIATDLTQDETITLGQAISVGNITFSDNGALGNSWILAPGGAFSLTLGTSTITTTTNATISAAVAGTAAVTKEGAATLTLSGGSSNTGAWAVNNGTLNVTTTAIAATSGIITVASTGSLTSTVGISKPVTINAGSTGNSYVGGGGTSNAIINGQATISGTIGTLTTSGTTNAAITASGGAFALNGIVTIGGSGTNTFTSNFVGASAQTQLTVTGTRSVSQATIQITGTYPTAIYQNGGTITATTDNVNGNCFKFGTNPAGYTYYAGSGGSLVGRSYLGFGADTGTNNGGFIVSDLSGTTLTSPGTYGTWFLGWPTPGNSINTSIVTGFGGTAHGFTTNKTVSTGTGATSLVVLTATQTGTVFSVGNGIQINISTGGQTAINATAGGMLKTGKIITSGTGTTAYRLCLYGGALSVTGDVAVPLDLYPLSGYSNQISGSTAATGTISGAIQEPTGYGLNRIRLASNGVGYIGAPAIKITGGSGAGATARAIFDLATGTITSIQVTCPGSGYALGDAITVTATGGGFSSAISITQPDNTDLVQLTAGQGVEKIETGTLSLLGTNTNTGVYTVTSGTLRIGNASAAGTLGFNDASNVAIASGAVLAFGRNDARTYSGSISGAGTVAVNGGGRATLSGVNTFTSAAAAIALTTANSVLRVTNGDSIGQGTSFGITVAGTTALELDGTLGNITTLPAKALTLSSTGTTAEPNSGGLRNIAGNNTYSGAIQFGSSSRINSDAGTLTLSSATALFGNSLSVGGAGDLSIAAKLNLGASYNVIKDGSGFCDFTYATASDHSLNTLTINAGTLGFREPSIMGSGTFSIAGNASAVNAGGFRFTGSTTKSVTKTISISGSGAGLAVRFEASGSAAITYNNTISNVTTNQTRTYQFGGTGTAANTVNFAVSNNGTGAVSLVKADAGTWRLTNTSNVYSGGTAINGGTLQLSIATWASGAKVTGTGAITVNTGGRIQTLKGSGGAAQNGRHTYTSLTFAANARIRIGG